MTVEIKASNEPRLVHPDSDELSRRLQAHGITLPRVAVSMLGYKAIVGYDADNAEPTGETYLLPQHDEGVVSVVHDPKKGIQIAEMTYGLKGQYAFNLVDFTLAHRDDLKSPSDAARYICERYKLEAEASKSVTAMVAVEPNPVPCVEPKPVPRELDLNYAISQTLQDNGLPLSVVAANLGFSVRRPNEGNELYVFDAPGPQAAFVAAIIPNRDGLEIAHYPYPVDGRGQVCAVRFAMQHGGENFRTPLDATASLKKMLPAANTLKAA